MIIKNLTPHDINFVMGDDNTITISPEETPVRVSTSSEVVGSINDIPVNKVSFGQVENIPEPKKDTIFIVSRLAAAALKEVGRKDDIYVVDDTVRDAEGNIVGCRALAQV